MGPCRLSQARQGTGDMFAKDEGCSSAVPGMGSRKLLFASSPRPAVPEGLEQDISSFFVFLCNNQRWIVLPSISVLCGSHQATCDH